ncbi:Ulp1 protease family [Abeliophyllum distichum]|uniref:Ulp1 protease family n=1 Tax=Abeliophyllum distichum TaxID=126358 RepID=A0ABD1RX69_9LAMI
MRDSTIKEKYFKKYDSISTECVENVFKELPSDTVDKDMVDVGIIYLISSFLFATSYHKCVDDSIFGLVESGEMESFSWGKELYSLTLMSLKGAFSKRIMKLDTSKKKLEYRLNGFLLAFQVWIYETIPAIAAKKLCVKYKQSLPRILSWSSNVHLTSLQLNKRIFDLIKLEVNDVRITDTEKNAAYIDGLFVNCQSEGQNANEDDDFEHPVIHQSNLMITAPESLVGDDSSSNLKKKKINDAENVVNDTMDLKKNLTDCPCFSLGIEFDVTGKSIEGPAEINVEKSLDEDIINFNEEDWKIVDDVAAHSLAKKMHQNTDDEVTPDAPLKRQKKPATLLQSPWVNQYDSAVGTSTVGTSTVGTTKRVLKGTSAFKVGMFSPCGSDVEAFESWYKQGLVTKKIRGLYDDFSKDLLVLVKQTSLLSYPIGLYMPCNTSWREVDHVLMPLRMYNSAHWILCHFDIKEMCLNIYNSYTKIVKEPVVLEAVRRFSVMIPYLLFHTGFFEGKNIPEQEALKPLVVKMVPKLQQQKNDGDCGIYVIKYAVYFINEMLKEMPKIFNIAQVRKHLATQLYVYAKRKQVKNYDTDNDWVPKDVCQQRRL